MAALQLMPIHLLVRPGLNIRDVSDLRGYRVGAGTALSGQTRLADLLFRDFKLGSEVLQPGPRAELLAGVDAAFRTAYYPAPNVYHAAKNGARLVPIDGPIVAAAPARIPVRAEPQDSRKHLSQSAGGGENDRGRSAARVPRPTSTKPSSTTSRAISSRRCRCSPASVRSSLRLTDLELTPATTIPLHKGAAQFYRERELAR